MVLGLDRFAGSKGRSRAEPSGFSRRLRDLRGWSDGKTKEGTHQRYVSVRFGWSSTRRCTTAHGADYSHTTGNGATLQVGESSRGEDISTTGAKTAVYMTDEKTTGTGTNHPASTFERSSLLTRHRRV
jgi:hypothetical protein